jgi:hypothetical protein
VKLLINEMLHEDVVLIFWIIAYTGCGHFHMERFMDCAFISCKFSAGLHLRPSRYWLWKQILWHVTQCNLVLICRRSSEWKIEPSMSVISACLHGLLLDPEDGGSKFLRHIAELYQIVRHDIPDDSTDYVRFEIFTAVTMKNVVFWDIKTPVRTSQETHYVSDTEPSRLMLRNIWGFHGRDYEECRLLGYKNRVRTSQETHYISATESSRLMLCKIWGFHGSDYEECRLLGYKNSVHTSQETHYVSATESSQLMLCKIWGFHGGWLWRMSSSGI